MVSITQIPAELLLLIALECSTYRDLASLMASCQGFYALLQRQLYRSEFYGQKGEHDFFSFSDTVDYPAGAAAGAGNVNMLDRWFACFPEFSTNDAKKRVKEAAEDSGDDEESNSSNLKDFRDNKLEPSALAHRDEIFQQALYQAAAAGQNNAVIWFLNCGISYDKPHRDLLNKALQGCHISTAMLVVRDAIKEQSTGILCCLDRICDLDGLCDIEELVDMMLGFARTTGPDIMIADTVADQYSVRDLIRYGVFSITGCGSPQLLPLFLRHGWTLYDAEEESRYGSSVVGDAIQNDNPEVVKFLLEGGHHGDLANFASEAWIILLRDFFHSENAVIYPKMFSSYTKFRVNSANSSQFLEEAVSSRNADLMEYLIAIVDWASTPERLRVEALEAAVELDSRRLLELVLEAGIENTGSVTSEECLHNLVIPLVCNSRAAECLEALVEAGADLSRPNRDRSGLTPLMEVTLGRSEAQTFSVCPTANSERCVALILRHWPSTIYAETKYGHTALEMAIRGSNGLITRALLSSKLLKAAQLNSCYKYPPMECGLSMLSLAVSQCPGNLRSDQSLRNMLSNERYIVEVLIEAGADVNYQDTGAYGETPLHHAAHYRLLDVVRYLVKQGADPTMLDRTGKNPVASTNGREREEADKSIQFGLEDVSKRRDAV